MTGGRIRSLMLLGVGVCSLGWAAIGVRLDFPRAKISFGRDVLPILSDKCFKCHGPDAGSRMADLRLDTREGATAARGGTAAVVPGKPDASLLVRRIHSAEEPMPPPDSGKSLTLAEREILTRWIAEGAPYGKLWSFEPLPESVPVPKAGAKWALDDLDRFVFDRLAQEGLAPSGPAPKWKWLRRVTLDLTGLPPSEQDIDAFLADSRPDSHERVVDRLLASSHFGERMAVEWLDAARYSDSYGYQSDLLMPTWPYRDWVIGAFNRNLPYDQFLTEQIAGDLLPNPTRDQVLATAFNRLHRQSNEGGSIPLEFKTEYAVDRVDTFGTAVLGLTLGCARCHDHKFDPITQREYYQLFAYFNSIKEFGLLLSTEIVPTPSLLLPTSEQEVRLTELRKRNSDALAGLAKAEEEAATRFRPSSTELPGISGLLARISLDKEEAGKFANSLSTGAFGAKLGKVEMVPGRQGQATLLDGDNGISVRGLPGRERWDALTWSFWLSDPRQQGPVVVLHRTGGTDVGFCGFDLMLEDGYLTARVMRHWPGNAVAIRTKTQVPKDQWSHIGWSWDGSGRAEGLKLYLDGNPASTEVVADKLWKKINAYGDLGSGGEWTFGQRFRDAGFKAGKIDEIAFADRVLSRAEIESLRSGGPVRVDRETYVKSLDDQAKQAREAVKKAQIELTIFEDGLREISVMEEAVPEVPAHVLARGQYDAPRTHENRVARGVPAVLPPLGRHAQNNRLALARWATHPDHPLTSRVAVNRLWQMLFGTGLVETSENFGVQGSQPSHPELLDFLARRFVEEGWDVKKALRHIVLSATYRQDSARSRSATRNPRSNVDDGRLYARAPSQRLSAEMVRDTALAASGLLTDRFGGPPVNAYQPAGIWTESNSMTPGFVQSTGTELYRRSIYSTWKRTTPVPSMMAFDATSREACTIRRPSTNTPMQALVLLNDVQFVEAARVLAEHVMRASLNDEERIHTAFRRLAGRHPTPRETSVLLQTLEEQRTQFQSDVSAALKLIRFGDSKPDPALRATELAAMTVTVQAILNSDAVIWKR